VALIDRLPPVRGRLLAREGLAPFTWFRVGGPAEALFLPADEDDLAAFLAAAPGDIPVTALGVGSNVIVRDGGVEGVVVRLAGRGFAGMTAHADGTLRVGAGALDARVAEAAADAGFEGLEFLVGIPGAIGGALIMNAGCYECEIKDVLVEARGVDRAGQRVVFRPAAGDVAFSYRHSTFPANVILTEAVLAGRPGGARETIRARMDAFKARREASQPIREKTGGSTFANPDPPGAPDQRKAWALIDAAGQRGRRRGGAQVSEKHCNFLINTGDATAADIEGLGEDVRAAVKAASGVDLRWEIKRIGRATPATSSKAERD
jgi:UDP-N-acetylmuramate dehydrogenase